MAGNCRSSQRKKNDPRCKHEPLILDDVCRYFQENVEVATEKLSSEEHDKFYDIFEDKDIYENIPKLLKAYRNSRRISNIFRGKFFKD